MKFWKNWKPIPTDTHSGNWKHTGHQLKKRRAQNSDYRHGLADALESLEDAEGHALNAVVNIAMAGPYQSISRLHKPGEILEFELAMFEGLGDTNIDIALRLFYQIRETKEKIKNLNGL